LESAACRDGSDAAHQAATIGTVGERIATSLFPGLAVRGRLHFIFIRLVAVSALEQILEVAEIEAAVALGKEAVVMMWTGLTRTASSAKA
jgi:hypothetical protein